MKTKEEIVKHYIETTNKKFPSDAYSKGYKEGLLHGLYWCIDIEAKQE